MRKKIALMSQPELVDEIVSLRLTCDELHQENKRLKKALKDICEPVESARCKDTIDFINGECDK